MEGLEGLEGPEGSETEPRGVRVNGGDQLFGGGQQTIFESNNMAENAKLVRER